MMSVDKRKHAHDGAKAIIDYRYVNNARRGRSVFQFILLAFSTAIYNFFRLYFTFSGINRPPSDHAQVKKLCIFGFGGIGNHLLLLPVIKALKCANPAVHLSVVTSSSVSAEFFKNSPDIVTTLVVNQDSRFDFINTVNAARDLRKMKPDAILAASGTNPVTGGLLSYMCGAKIRVGEDWHGRGWFYTGSVKTDQTSSEIEQNFRLAGFFNAAVKKEIPELYLDANEIRWGQDWLESRGLKPDSRKIGIHPGCGISQKWKRWDIRKFFEVVDDVCGKVAVDVVFFLGPDDFDLKKHFDSIKVNQYVLFSDKHSIRSVAAVISQCDVFLSNDSGLRHIAAAVNVKTVGIFGPTSVKKNFISNRDHVAITADRVACRPCHYTGWWLGCGDKRPCLQMVGVEDVARKVLMQLSVEPQSR